MGFQKKIQKEEQTVYYYQPRFEKTTALHKDRDLDRDMTNLIVYLELVCCKKQQKKSS